MKLLRSLADRWRTEAETLARYGDDRGAIVARLHADQLEEAAAEIAAETLTLSEAAAESGYSERRLRELLTSGEIPQAGRKGAPRIRRGDLPKKAGTTAAGEYDADADAHNLLSKMRRAS